MTVSRFTKRIVRETLRKTHGNVSAAARALGVSRTAIHERMRNDPELAAIVVESRETLVDNAESALASAALRGEAWAVCFALKCLGKSRGYIERVQVGGDPENPLVIGLDLAALYGRPATPNAVAERLAAPLPIESSNGNGQPH